MHAIRSESPLEKKEGKVTFPGIPLQKLLPVDLVPPSEQSNAFIISSLEN